MRLKAAILFYFFSLQCFAQNAEEEMRFSNVEIVDDAKTENLSARAKKWV